MRSIDEDEQRLCRRCGLCCDGGLFQRVRLRDRGEVQRMQRLGELTAGSEGKMYLAQPCQFHTHGSCQVYGDRPRRCREFRCKMLEGYRSGDLGFDDALDIIDQAKQRRHAMRQARGDQAAEPDRNSISAADIGSSDDGQGPCDAATADFMYVAYLSWIKSNFIE